MASAGTLTLTYDDPSRTFTATLTALTGFTAMSVQLNSPAGGNYAMSSAAPANNPSKWTYTFPPPPPPPMPDFVTPGTWVAVGLLQAVGTATGACNV